jgi:hypothetical protein
VSGALGPAEDGADDDEWSREADGHSSAVLPWPESCRILMMIFGATGSGKTRLLRPLAGCAASFRSRPRWPSGRSILDGLGADGAARSGAVGADGAWPMAVGGAAASAVRPRCGGAANAWANGGAATATAVRRCGDGGAATAVRREALLAGSSLSPLPRRSISVLGAPFLFASRVAAAASAFGGTGSSRMARGRAVRTRPLNQ